MSITRVQSNTNAFLASAQLSKLDNSLTNTLERLSSGLRINRSADDPSGVTSSAVLRSRISSMEAAIQNTQEAVGFFGVIDQSMSAGIDLLTRLKDIAIQAGNSATLTTSQFSSLETEFSNLVDDLYSLGNTAKYGNRLLLTGALSGGNVGFQVGVETTDFISVNFSAFNLILSTNGLSAAISGVSLGGTNSAAMAFSAANSALEGVTGALGLIGAQARRLDSILTQLEDERANAIAANSNVSDADLAAEITNLATGQIRAQAATAALAQANSLPSLVVQLLGNI